MKEPDNNELFFSKIDDKIRFCNTRNKITNTDFYTEPEIMKIEKYLKSKNIDNYFFFGGYDEANRKILFFYPKKLSYEIALSNVNNVLEIIRIKLPNSQKDTFEHSDYLSGIMKFGIVREKFGDIVAYSDGADIIVQKENSLYFKDNLAQLTRFRKAEIEILDISELNVVIPETKEISIIVNSMRIDNFVSEICHCSRNKACEIIVQERVMINYEIINKNSKNVNLNDIITIRGYGKFIVKELSRKTKSNKNVVTLEGYKK